MKLTFDAQGVLIDGRREFLVSGEFHYFRVPQEDWRRRMELFKEAGGNCLATYVPWLIHEPEEGNIVFGDQPKRDFARFLETAAAAGLPNLFFIIGEEAGHCDAENLNDVLESRK